MCPPICRFADFFGEPALRTEKATQDRRAWSGCCSGIHKNSDAASHAEAEFLRIPLPANFRALSRLNEQSTALPHRKTAPGKLMVWACLRHPPAAAAIPV